MRRRLFISACLTGVLAALQKVLKALQLPAPETWKEAWEAEILGVV